MSTDIHRAKYVLNHPLWFLGKVVTGFRANQGFLLSGAVAYYTLLSIVPMLALILIVLSQLVDSQQLLDTTSEYLGLVTPVEASDVVRQITVVLLNWKLFGAVGLMILLFFSSLAFTMLENAMSVIFFHRVVVRRRHFLVSAIIPYCYIFVLALGMLIVSMVSGTIHSLDDKTFLLSGHEWSLSGMTTGIVYVVGILGEVLLLTSLYLVMPTGRLALSHALIGGITATILWEITRHFLVWYFATLSVVNIVYGTFATAIIILLSLEAAALILLLGAQVISEYERIGNEEYSQPDLHT